jgi:hypothetical protein
VTDEWRQVAAIAGHLKEAVQMGFQGIVGHLELFH